MAPQKQEQQILCQAALTAIGRVLRQEFQSEAEPERMRELLAELEAKGKNNKEK
jgi:hypothetical protein